MKAEMIKPASRLRPLPKETDELAAILFTSIETASVLSHELYAKLFVILSEAKDLWHKPMIEIPRYARNDNLFRVLYNDLLNSTLGSARTGKVPLLGNW